MPILHKPRPNPDTGLGLHDSNLAGSNPPDIAAHARALRAAGFTWYKILADGRNKVERTRVYREHGIMSVVRLWSHKPHPAYLPDPAVVRAYVEAGAIYIETGNEPNLAEEWSIGFPGERAGVLTAQQWLSSAGRVLNVGGIPVTYAPTPGGHINHRIYTEAFVQELDRLGALGLLRQGAIGIHPRPLNNPPDARIGTGSPPNTTTWNEHKWFIDFYTQALGGDTPVFLATEHGYSPKDRQNTDHPPMDDSRWAGFNKELFERMNPDHEEAVHPALYALFYWLEVNQGAGGVWGADAPFGGQGELWIGDGARGEDKAWGKAIWQIQPTWSRASATEEPVTPPAPTPTPKPPEQEFALPPWVAYLPADEHAPIVWKIVSARMLGEHDSGGRHHIYIMEPHDPAIMGVFHHYKNGELSQTVTLPLEKEPPDPAQNFAMYGVGNTYGVSLYDPVGIPADSLMGLKLEGWEGQPNEHVSFEIVYQRVRQEEEGSGGTPAGVTWQEQLVQAGESVASVPVTPGFALYDAILADGWIPNGNERTIIAVAGEGLKDDPLGIVPGDSVRVRSGESPDGKGKRTYYIRVPEPGEAWGKVRSVDRESPPMLATPPALPPAPAPSLKLAVPWVSQLGQYARYGIGDCGPACVSSVLAYKGVIATPDRIALAMGLQQGFISASIYTVEAALKHFGTQAYNGQASPGWEGVRWLLHELDQGRPVIALLDYQLLPYRSDPNYRSGHFVTVVGYQQRDDQTEQCELLYHDPYWQQKGNGSYCWIDALPHYPGDPSFMEAWSSTDPSTRPQPRRYVAIY